MATQETNLADRSGNLVDSHKGYDPRIIFFYFVFAGLLALLTGGLAYQQIYRISRHSERERQQNQRRILFPGPRGNIYDRKGTPLVVNNPRWTVVLYLDELKAELFREHVRIHKNYVATVSDKKEAPSYDQIDQLARASIAQRYLDQVNKILGSDLTVDRHALQIHFSRELLLPFTLVDDLDDASYARLIERLPVNSPLQVYASFTRHYPFGSAAAHTLGYVRADTEAEARNFEAKGFPGGDLTTFKMKNTHGRNGLERRFDAELQGEAGGRIFRVDPAGYRINPPLAERKPTQGKNLTTSLDIDLQLTAEAKLAQAEVKGSAVALDVTTGEILALASKPDYDLNDWYPHMPTEKYRLIQEQGAEFNLALNGLYPPGSTFKVLVSIAGMRSGLIDPSDTSIDCTGTIYLGRTRKTCDNGNGHHGHVDLSNAISVSCDIYFYRHGIELGPETIAREARRFHLDQPTGIELPGETHAMIVPDQEWERVHEGGVWTEGDTANVAIGQGALRLTPLQMACFAASVARGELYTKPTLLHDPGRPAQHTESMGLTAEQRAVLLSGMEGVITRPGGTAHPALSLASEKIPGLRIAAKTGTAQLPGKYNEAWFICFAPLEKPEIAVAVAVQSDAPGEFGGGRNAGPIANAILKKYFEKKNIPAQPVVSPLKTKS